MPDSSTSALPKEAADFIAAHPGTRAIDAIYADLSGIVRGKRYPIDHLGKLMTDGLATPGSVFLLDSQGESHDPCGLGFSDGDPDYLVSVIPGSLLPVPWCPQPTAQVMLTFANSDGTPYPYEPRNVLAQTVAELGRLGLRPMIAFELEFYLIDRERLADNSPQPPCSPIDGKRMSGTQVYSISELDAFAELIDEITATCAAQGIETGAITAEYAPGQFEINLQHINDAMLAADQCIMFKRVVRGVARKHGVEATFMAKPYLKCAGSGLHMHCSLLDADGRNVFADGDSIDEPANTALRHAIGGVLELMPEAMAILAPNSNSFRRYVPNIFVPVTRSWAHENRSVALRIPRSAGAARRIEHRIAGADANPYLALATFLAGICRGLGGQIDPGAAWQGNAGESADPEMPFRPRRALERLRDGGALAQHLGNDYIQAYCACKLAELDRFESSISPAEYSWYLQTD